MEASGSLPNQKSNAECSPLLAGSDGEMMKMKRNLGLKELTKREKVKTKLTIRKLLTADREKGKRGLNL